MNDINLYTHSFSEAFAYIDAGAGSMLLQATIAGALTAGYFLKTQWRMIKATAVAMVKGRSKNGA